MGQAGLALAQKAVTGSRWHRIQARPCPYFCAPGWPVHETSGRPAGRAEHSPRTPDPQRRPATVSPSGCLRWLQATSAPTGGLGAPIQRRRRRRARAVEYLRACASAEVRVVGTGPQRIAQARQPFSAGGAAEMRERAVGGGLSEGRWGRNDFRGEFQRSTPLPSILLLLCALASSTVQLVLSGCYLHSAPSSAGPARPFPVPRRQKASVYLTWNPRDDANGAPSTREASSPGSARSGRRNHQQARGQQQQQLLLLQRQRQRQSGWQTRPPLLKPTVRSTSTTC